MGTGPFRALGVMERRQAESSPTKALSAGTQNNGSSIDSSVTELHARTPTSDGPRGLPCFERGLGHDLHLGALAFRPLSPWHTQSLPGRPSGSRLPPRLPGQGGRQDSML